MKAYLTFLWIGAGLMIGMKSFAQGADSTSVNVGKRNIVTVVEDQRGTNVNVNDEFVVVDDLNDTVRIKLGNKAISIHEDGDRTQVEIIEEKDFEKHGWRKRSKGFKGHYAGFELGLNNLVNAQGQLVGTTPETRFMDLNTGKSWEWNLNFMQFNLPMGSKIGWVTGMGFKKNNYHFDNNNSLTKDPVTGEIIPLLPPAGVTYDKNKLNTGYLTVPLLLEYQFGPRQKGFVSVGVIGDLKLYSNTKLRYLLEGSKQKEKSRSDFNLSPLRYHLTARLGYRFVKLYANYSMVSLFKSNLGPELYPVSIGLTLISFR